MTTEWFGNDHPALRRTWNPVARVADVDGPGPHPVRLLGDDWALVQLDDSWSLLPDRCPHRLAPLTAGEVIGDTVRCGYHGWRFDGSGTCVAIPAIGDSTIPPSAHLTAAAAVEERYGLVWVAVDDPVTPIPAVPEWDDTTFGIALLPVSDWAAGAAQMADNFLDVAHFPFTHAATIGDPDDVVVGAYEVEREGWVFGVEHRHSATTLDGSGTFERVMTFECTAPHHVRLGLDYGPDGRLVLLFFHQPVDAGTTRLHCVELAENLADGRVDPDEAIAFQLSVAEEDRSLLEQLRTKGVPLGPGIETHTRADRITVELRRVLADLARSGRSQPGASVAR